MSYGNLYINTDVDILLPIGSGFVVGDISDLEVILKNGAFSKSYKKSLNDITIVSTTIKLFIDRTHISIPGRYTVKILMTDTGNEVRGLTPTPDHLIFLP